MDRLAGQCTDALGIRVQQPGRYRSTFCIEVSGLAATETNMRWSPSARVSSWPLLLLSAATAAVDASAAADIDVAHRE